MGRRNYRYFVSFVATSAATALLVLACAIFVLVDRGPGPSLAVLVVSAVLAALLLRLLNFHVWLILHGLTTHQYFHESEPPPYNCHHIPPQLCAP